MPARRGSCLAAGLLAASLAFAWQSATVRFNYAGHWTALFCTGAKAAVPPQLDSERIHTFSGSTGYDGQFYHYVAHDPLLQGNLSRYMDAPEWRYRRILVPALAFLLAGGQARFVDAAYYFVVLLCVFLGAYWLSRFALLRNRSPWWGLVFLAVPAAVISLDRMTVDVALAAMAAGLLVYAESGPVWRVWTLLAAAALTRETGLLLVAGFCAHGVLHRKWVRSLIIAAAPLPAFGWYLYVQSRAIVEPDPTYIQHAGAHWPGEALWFAITHPASYPFAPPLLLILRLLDYAGLAGALLAVALALWIGLRRPASAVEIAAALYALMALVLGAATGWIEPYGYTRTLSPLVMILAARGLATGAWWLAAPLALMAARVLVQLGPQIAGILRGLSGTA